MIYSIYDMTDHKIILESRIWCEIVNILPFIGDIVMKRHYIMLPKSINHSLVVYRFLYIALYHFQA